MTEMVSIRYRPELPLGTVDGAVSTGQSSCVIDGRLRHQHPRVAEWLESSDQATRVERVRLLAQHVAGAAGVSDACNVAEHLDALVDALDEAAWTIHDALDRGASTSDQYEIAFRRARAASSWAIAHLDSSLEGSFAAVYEALAALGGSESAVLALLKGPD